MRLSSEGAWVAERAESQIRSRYGYTEHYGKIITLDPLGEGFVVLRPGSAVGVRRHLSGAQVDSLAAPGMPGSIELDEAVHGLATRHPELSAATRLWGWQKAALAGLVLGVGGGTLLAPETTLAVLFAVMAVPFLCVVVLRSAALWNLFAPPAPAVEPPPVRIDAELLPLYSVLVPLYREASVIPHLVAALTAIDYPAARLEILLVIESIDADTQTALRAAALPRHMRVFVVPDGDPRTKPRAIQYALQFAHGDYVVVYDAEDVPEPDQLRRALAALMAEPGRLGCLQARLNIYNSRASWLTRQFTIEYTALFDCILPTLERFELPVPLGGTSNHFRRDVLDAVGGWDPYNVTEDADLGIRLARAGWHVGILGSTTWEEAPPTFRIWLGQRKRWHTHPLGQTLIITAGCGRVQREHGRVEEVHPDVVICFPPGEKHWHGATLTEAMSHIAIQEQLDAKLSIGWSRSATSNIGPDLSVVGAVTGPYRHGRFCPLFANASSTDSRAPSCGQE